MMTTSEQRERLRDRATFILLVYFQFEDQMCEGLWQNQGIADLKYELIM